MRLPRLSRWGGLFSDRIDAGRRLAPLLAHLASQHPLVVALPRGGVPVAVEVARALDAPLDVVVVRKLGHPQQPELAVGAVGEGGVRVLNTEVLGHGWLDAATLDALTVRESAEVERRLRSIRGDRPPVAVAGRTVVVVDDGLATGSTAEAAVQVLRARGAGRVVLAVPVAPPDTVRRLRQVADEVVCVQTPDPFVAIGPWYDDFTQVDDATVARLLGAAWAREAAGPAEPAAQAGPADPARAVEVSLDLDGVTLPGTLTVPHGASGLVVFAHGSGSSRTSPRNVAVARTLTDAGLATLLFDLLTPAEARDRARVFDIPLLALRLAGAAAWARGQPGTAGLRLGFFGASTGAAAALVAAARLGDEVAAVVSRGGRPDLAGAALPRVKAPTLLVVGGEDWQVLELNERARQAMTAEVELVVVPGATHLFEEPGTLAAAAGLARDWFRRHLGGVAAGAP